LGGKAVNMDILGTVMREKKRLEADAAEKYGVTLGGRLCDVASGMLRDGFLYVELGGDRMLPIDRANSRGDVWAGIPATWFCSTPDARVYVKKSA
jgi:hypothetical protein